MKIFTRKQSFFSKLVFSYVIISICPVLFIFALLYNNYVISLSQEISSYNRNNLQRISDTMDAHLQECRNIAIQISGNPKLSYPNLSDNGAAIIEGSHELAKYGVGNLFIESIYINFNNEDIFYSSRGKSDIQSLANYYYRFTEEEKKALLHMLSNNQTSKLLYLSNADMVFYSKPYPTSLLMYRGMVLFSIKGSSMRQMINNKDNPESIYMIADEGNNAVFASSLPGLDHPFPISLSEKFDIVNDKATYNNMKFSLYTVKSETNSWSFVSLIPSASTEERIVKQILLITALCMIILVFFILLAVKLASNNAKPVISLNRMINSLTEHTPSNSVNELENITHLVNDTIAHNRNLMSRVDDQRKYLYQDFFVMLVNGVFSDPEKARERMEALGIEQASQYCSMYINLPHEHNYTQLSMLADGISKIGAPDLRVYAVDISLPSTIAVIVFLEKTNYQPLLRGLSENIMGICGYNCTIGIGRPYLELLKIENSFIEAGGVLKYFPASSDNILFFENVLSTANVNKLIITDEIYLMHTIRQGNIHTSMANLDKIFNQLQIRRNPGQSLGYNCYKLLDVVMGVAAELKLYSTENTGNSSSIDYLLSEIDLLSFNSFKQRIYKIVEQICVAVTNDNIDRNNALNERIRAYISDSYKKPDCSLDSLSLAFGNSVYYWSHFFKENLGINFSDYLWNLRFTEAKHLLLDTSRSIIEISQEVGYLDPNSFTRKFKAAQGIAPGQYRKLYGSGTKC